MLAWRICPIRRFAESQNRMSRRARLRSRSSERVRASPATLRALVCVLLHSQASSTLLRCPQREGANMSKNQANQSHLLSSGLGPAIDSELAVLASIEARYAHEVTRLESSGTPPSEHLRSNLTQGGRWPENHTFCV